MWAGISKYVRVHVDSRGQWGASSSITVHVIYFVCVFMWYQCACICRFIRYVSACEFVDSHAHAHTHTHWCRGLKLTSNDLDHVLLYLFMEAEPLTVPRTLASELIPGIPFLHIRVLALQASAMSSWCFCEFEGPRLLPLLLLCNFMHPAVSLAPPQFLKLNLGLSDWAGMVTRKL